jgi:hypothetical protein
VSFKEETVVNLAKDDVQGIAGDDQTYQTEAESALNPVSDHLDVAWQSLSGVRIDFAGALDSHKKAVMSVFDSFSTAIVQAGQSEPQTRQTLVWVDDPPASGEYGPVATAARQVLS